MNQSPSTSGQDELWEQVTEMIAKYLKGIHHPDEDPLENDLRAMKNTDDLKAAIQQLIQHRETVRAIEELEKMVVAITVSDFDSHGEVIGLINDRLAELSALEGETK